MQRRKPNNKDSSSQDTGAGDTAEPSASTSHVSMQREAVQSGAAICSAALLLAVVVAAMLLLLQPEQPELDSSQAAKPAAPLGDPAGRFARGLQPPYYAAIFTSQRWRGSDDAGYAATAARIIALASTQPGYLGVESTRDVDGLGITVSYWRTAADIAHWRRQLEHEQARDGGRARWYSHYELRVAKVERAYAWDAAEGPNAPLQAREAWLQQDLQ